MSMKNSNDTIGNRNRDLPVYRAVPQPTALHTQNKTQQKQQQNIDQVLS
jgi:hypothetical protein